jgi:hypothetical protein
LTCHTGTASQHKQPIMKPAAIRHIRVDRLRHRVLGHSDPINIRSADLFNSVSRSRAVHLRHVPRRCIEAGATARSCATAPSNVVNILSQSNRLLIPACLFRTCSRHSNTQVLHAHSSAPIVMQTASGRVDMDHGRRFPASGLVHQAHNGPPGPGSVGRPPSGQPT